MSEPKPVWDRPEPASRPAPVPLSRERIVAAAIELADAEGLAAVSLRKVAAALGAGPMRLYGYIDTKEDLFDLMVDAVYGEVRLPESTSDWRSDLREIAHETWRCALRHEWFAELLGGRPHLGPNALRYLEVAFATFGDRDVDTIMVAFGALNSYVVGALRTALAELNAERATGMTEDEWRLTRGPYLAQMVATGHYPALAKIMAETTYPDPATLFDPGLEILLDGIAARLA
ncbi:TetR/AcrR family transcriptional regulator [Streptomyces sp. NPDC047072]|uniref:TetR/AcrR family transcriptional regulator n=1 Tax=Streptomyces sp. NPDC047072 TaxID=3154809 RepID=UPI0033FAB14E